MRRERRHELKENELAELLGRWVMAIAPYSRAILTGFILLLVLYIGWAVWASWSRSVEHQAWNELYGALETGGPAELQSVAEQYPRTEAGHWARLLAADLHLRVGCQEMLVNKANAAQEIRKAIDGYLAVRDVKGSDMFQQRVLWGLARAYEALSGTRQGQGELDNAIKLYNELVERWPDGPYATLAQRRIAFLSQPENKRFYDLFAAYEAQKPVSTELPPAGAAPLTPPPLPSATQPSENAQASGSSPAGTTETEKKPAESQPAPSAEGSASGTVSGSPATPPTQQPTTGAENASAGNSPTSQDTAVPPHSPTEGSSQSASSQGKSPSSGAPPTGTQQPADK